MKDTLKEKRNRNTVYEKEESENSSKKESQSSLHNNIFNSFCLILVLWSLLAKAKLSICDV